MSDSDILCTVCHDGSSKTPNEIVICDICNQGYHQLCHKPSISDAILKPDVPWNCRKCVFALAAKEGGAEKDTAVGESMTQMKTVLPYDLKSLCWDSSHYVNQQNTYCYCGGPGEYFSKMLQCHQCFQWFHEACIQALDVPLLYGDHYYNFMCAVCNKGKEYVKRIIMKWSDMVALVLHNLSYCNDKVYFDVYAEIIPFIRSNCERLKLNVDLKKMKEKELSERVVKILCDNSSKFLSCGKDGKKKHLWALNTKAQSTRKGIIFAPPFAVSGDNSLRSSKIQNSSTHDRTSARMCSSPKKSSVPFPMVYGACRKGPSIYPKPSPQKLRSSASSAISCAASTTSNSSSNARTTSRSDSLRKRKHPTKMKAKSGSSITSDNSDCEASGTATLDSFIPMPDNFDGTNNPFYDLEGQQKERKYRKLIDSKDYRIINSSSSSKFTLQRINVSEKDDESSAFLSQEELNEESVQREKEKYTVLARRMTKDGKVEYLLEWDTN
ncbi:metal-response element-binding transcription factor 2-like protein [Leptotrombidium deliense]|uniref:Metal-response element-binding transcription factor 2-like protein n=1 Tax=Leptotrombidium deliense TaxID=299467 RepID=A0A443SKH6_9ACAR|nr:metal-response element-binding transcription factor 2-like protein [Leptotrombidium deliense]